MKNIKILELPKHKNTDEYKLIEKGIYKDLTSESKWDDIYRVAFTLELEEGEDSQNPLEYVLDTYSIHVQGFFETNNPKIMNLEFGGRLEGIKKILEIEGKRVYERPYIDKKGIELIIK